MMFISEGVHKDILKIVHHLLLDVYIALCYYFNDSTLLMKLKVVIGVTAVTTCSDPVFSGRCFGGPAASISSQ
jgi:hypothetical protein